MSSLRAALAQADSTIQGFPFGQLNLKVNAKGLSGLETQMKGLQSEALKTVNSLALLKQQAIALDRVAPTKVTAGFNELTRSVGDFGRASKTINIGQWLGIYQGFRAMAGGVRDALNIDREVVRYSQITNTAVSSNQAMAKSAVELGIKYGAATEKLIAFNAELEQMGVSSKGYAQVGAAVSKSSQLKDPRDIAHLVAIQRNTFGLGDEQIQANIGKSLKMSRMYPVNMENIVAGQERGAPVFANSRNGFEELTASVVVAANKTQQSGETIGVALKTIWARLQDLDHIKALKGWGVDLMDGEGKVVSYTEALKRLSDATAGLQEGDPKRNAILTEAGGLHHISILTSLVDGYEDYKRVMSELGSIDGGAELFKEANISLQSLSGQVDRVTEAFKGLWTNAIQTGPLNEVLRNLTGGVADLLQKLGGAGPLLAGLGAGFAVKKFLPTVGMPDSFKSSGLTGLFDKFSQRTQRPPVERATGQMGFEFYREELQYRNLLAQQAAKYNALQAGELTLKARLSAAAQQTARTLGGMLTTSVERLGAAAQATGSKLYGVGKSTLRTAFSRGGLEVAGMVGGTMLGQREGVASQAVGAGLGAAGLVGMLGFGPVGIAAAGLTSAFLALESATERAAEAEKTKATEKTFGELRTAGKLGDEKRTRGAVFELDFARRIQERQTNEVGGFSKAGRMTRNLFTLDWGNLGPSAAGKQISDERREGLKSRFSGNDALLEAAAQQLAKRKTSVQDFQRDPIGGGIIKLLSLNEDEAVVRSHIKAMIESNNAEKQRVEATKRLVQETDNAARTLNGIAASVYAKSQGLRTLQTTFETATPPKPKSLSDPQSWLPDMKVNGWGATTNKTMEAIPGIPEGVKSLAASLGEARKGLPNFIDKYRSSWKPETFQSLFGGLLQERGMGLPPSKENTQLVQAISASVKNIKWEEFNQGLQNVEGLSDRLLQSFDPLLASVKETASSFDSFQNSLLVQQTATNNAKITAVTSQGTANNAALAADNMVRGFRKQPLDTEAADRSVQSQVEMLTGFKDVGSITAQLKSFQDMLKKTNDIKFASGIERCTTALNLLTNTSERLANRQAELGKLQASKDGRIGGILNYLQAGPEERAQMDRDMATTKGVIGKGLTFDKVGIREQQAVVRSLQPLSEVQNVFGSGKTGRELLEQFIGGQKLPEEGGINKLQAEMIGVLRDSAKAQQSLANAQLANYAWHVEQLNTFGQSFVENTQNVFNNGAEALTKIASMIPSEISLQGRHTVEVNITGAMALTQLEPMIQRLVINAVEEALNRANRDPTRPPAMR